MLTEYVRYPAQRSLNGLSKRICLIHPPWWMYWVSIWTISGAFIQHKPTKCYGPSMAGYGQFWLVTAGYSWLWLLYRTYGWLRLLYGLVTAGYGWFWTGKGLTGLLWIMHHWRPSSRHVVDSLLKSSSSSN